VLALVAKARSLNDFEDDVDLLLEELAVASWSRIGARKLSDLAGVIAAPDAKTTGRWSASRPWHSPRPPGSGATWRDVEAAAILMFRVMWQRCRASISTFGIHSYPSRWKWCSASQKMS